MKAWQWSVVALACLAAAACRSDPNIPYLERDLRMQEDKIYQLKALRDDDEATLDSCRRENATLRKRLVEAEESGSGAPGAARPSGDSQAAPRWSGPAGMPGPEVKPPAVDLGAPSTEVPEAFKPQDEVQADRTEHHPRRRFRGPAGQDRRRGSARETRRREVVDRSAGRRNNHVGARAPAGHGRRAPAASPGTAQFSPQRKRDCPLSTAKPAVADNKQIQKIVLNRLLTGGYNTSGRSGHDGVMVVIEPRNAKGEVLTAPGELSVVVIDPALGGAESRVARWDFTADEVAARFRKTVVANGIQLEMPWPAEPPQNEDLHVFVRYTTADGRQLEADKPIKVKPPIEVVERNAAAAGNWRGKPRAGDSAAASEPAAPVPEPTSRADTWRAAPRATVRVPTSPIARPASRTSRGVESTAARPVWSPTRQ